MKTPALVFDAHTIGRQLNDMAQQDGVRTDADRRTREYYAQGNVKTLWIDRGGVDSRADSLLVWLRQVDAMGMNQQAFMVKPIEDDLRRLRTLDVDGGENSINRVAARLEYRLTKACMRYCYGQRFGFVNPHRVFNHLDVEKVDSVRRITRYRGLFDMSMDLPTAGYAAEVIGKIMNDSLTEYLRDIQPQSKFYQTLKGMLAQAANDEQRQRIICNMERARWRLHHPIPDEGKRVVVNIPAYELYAYGGDTVLNMRVVCGAQKTKTPQLTSEVEWMEVNPQWVIPMSIVEKDVVRHTGDSAYFARNKYTIYAMDFWGEWRRWGMWPR